MFFEKEKVMIKKVVQLIIMCLVFCFVPMHALYNGVRTSSEPYISGDTFRAYADYCFDDDSNFEPSSITKPCIIFVQTDFLDVFFKSKHPLIQVPYVLVTHNSDCGAPGKFACYLDDPKLIHWFAQNPTIANHPKFTAIPIGIANQFWPHGKKEMFNVVMDNKKKATKDIILYINFASGFSYVDEEAFRIYAAERADALNKLAAKPFSYLAPRKAPADYLMDVARSKFVASPRGHGLDCHRTWEALLMGSYPIVKTSPLDGAYKDLPVVIVNDWSELTEEFLQKKYEALSSKPWNVSKIYAHYWADLIKKTLREACA
jgi:hypothetical protein